MNPPKVKTRFTNTKGQKKIVYTDGTSEFDETPESFYAKENAKAKGNKVELRKGNQLNPTVSANDLTNPPTAPNFTPPKVGTLPNTSLVKNVAGETQNIITAKTKEAEDLAKLRQENAAFMNEGSLADLFQAKKDEYGVDETFRELKDINLQLSDANTATDMQKAQIAGAKGQTLGQGQREVTQEDREGAVRNSGLAARAAVLQGNLETASALAKEAVTIAYQDRTLKQQNLLSQLNDLSGVVDKQTQQLVDQAKAEAEEELRQIQRLETEISNAMVNGASQAEIAQLTSSQLDDASKLALAQSITARGAGELRNLDIQSKQASINASNASAYSSSLSARKSILELAQGGEPQAIADLGFDPRDLNETDSQVLAYAQQYATDGKIPTGLKDAGVTFGQVAQLAKSLPQAPGALVSAQTGVKDANIPAAEQGDLSRLYNIVQMTKELKTLDEGRNDGLVAGTLNRVFGNETQNSYLTKRKAIVDEIARMQTGAALTVDEQNFYNDYLPGATSNPLGLGTNSTAKIEEFASVMESKLQNALATNGLVVYGYSPVEIGGQTVTVGDIITNEQRQRGRVNADGSITAI